MLVSRRGPYEIAPAVFGSLFQVKILDCYINVIRSLKSIDYNNVKSLFWFIKKEICQCWFVILKPILIFAIFILNQNIRHHSCKGNHIRMYFLFNSTALVKID